MDRGAVAPLAALIALIALIALLTACSKPAEAPKGPDPVGKWTVVAFAAPGISAMTDTAAQIWIDRVADFRPNFAVFADDTCPRARYAMKQVKADSFFMEGFRVDATKLGFAADSTIWVTEVWCGPDVWSGAGSLLMWLHPDSMYTVFDGEFFKLARQAPIKK
jgi:hypothetical protein